MGNASMTGEGLKPPRKTDAAAAVISRHINPVTAVWVIMLFLLAATWLGLLYHLQLERRGALASAQRQVGNYARLLDEHTLRTVRVLDQTTMFVKSEFERTGGELDLTQYASRGVFLDQLFNLIAIAREDGTVTNIDRKIPISNIADREHFKVHVNNDTTGLFISQPVLGRSSGKWSVQFTRRLNHPDGSFAGVVVASLDPKYFSDFYRSLDMGPEGAATLIGMDGFVRARRSGENESIGQNISNAQLFQQLKTAGTGMYTASSAVDKISRLYAYRRMDAYPLVVTVGLAEQFVYADYYEHKVVVCVLGGIASVFVLGMGLVLLSLIKNQERVQQALRASARDAESASRMKSEFIARMSHELRTPLNGILGLSEYLKSSLEGGENQEFAADIYKSGAHLLQLVNTTLDLAKIEEGRMEVTGQAEELGPLAHRAMSMQRAFAESKGLSFDHQRDDGLPAHVICDGTKVTQILNNLLHNAIKFTQSGGVSMRVSADSIRVYFAVTDTGPGLSEEQQAQLFQRFRQLDKGFETRTHEGSGLGLALAKELAELMGGAITVKSKPGEGSMFTLALPLRRRASDRAGID